MIIADLRDEKLNNMKHKFNEMLINNNQALSASHYQLETMSDGAFSALEWREFKIHPVVTAWLEEELDILVRNKAFDLMKDMGTNNSTATNQAVMSALNYLDKKKDTVQNPTIFIYSFVPLSEQEREAPNVRILENVPTEIRDAIVHIK